MAQPQAKEISETKWDPTDYDRTARFVTDLGELVLRLLGPKRGERILDLGCGDGPLTKRIAETGHVPVPLGPAETMSFLRAESARYKKIVEDGKITAD
mgnify:CR=1 FL=1